MRDEDIDLLVDNERTMFTAGAWFRLAQWKPVHVTAFRSKKGNKTFTQYEVIARVVPIKDGRDMPAMTVIILGKDWMRLQKSLEARRIKRHGFDPTDLSSWSAEITTEGVEVYD